MSGEFALSKQSGGVVNDQRNDLQIAYGTTTPSAGSEAVATGLSFVLSAVAQLEGAPSAAVNEPAFATAGVGDQAGSPAAGSILLESWQDDFVTAASSGFEAVNWIAIGY